jgi:8-oxo-dGTP diphosphatase
VPAELARLERALAGGLQLIQLRDKTLPPTQRRQLAEAVMTSAGHYPNVRVLINDDPGLAREIGAHGVHFSSHWLWQLDGRPACGLVAASCHTAADLARAAELALDFVVLGPVLPTASHPAASGIGWPEFARLIERSPLPVYALGGLRPSMLDDARRHGAHGIAALRGWAPA